MRNNGKYKYHLVLLRQISTNSTVSAKKQPNLMPLGTLQMRKLNPLPLPHRTVPEAKGQDLDYVNVAHSHLIRSDWAKLNSLAAGLTPFKIKHILLKIKKDPVISLEFFDWVELQRPNSHTLEIHSIMLHILTKAKKFKIAESLLKRSIIPKTMNSASELFDCVLYSYRVCDSSPCVFDSLFKTYAHMKKFRNATDTFRRMKDYGFLPTIESCNAYMSSLLDLHRTDIALAFYRELGRCRISSNVYTLNMVMSALCKSGRLEKAVELFREMENMGCRPTSASFNTLIAGHSSQGLMNSAMKLKTMMSRNGLCPDIVTYNALIHGYCKEGKLHDASKMFGEMKAMDVVPNAVTYNTLINGYSQYGNSEMGSMLYEEMLRNGVKVDILTYNALILGLCNEGKTKRASYLVKKLLKENIVPNASTFAALISGQCKRQKPERAFQLYKNMRRSGCHPNANTFNLIISTFCKKEDFDGAVQVLREMLERAMVPDANMLAGILEGLHRCENAEAATRLRMELEGKHFLPEDSYQRFKIRNLLLNQNSVITVSWVFIPNSSPFHHYYCQTSLIQLENLAKFMQSAKLSPSASQFFKSRFLHVDESIEIPQEQDHEESRPYLMKTGLFLKRSCLD